MFERANPSPADENRATEPATWAQARKSTREWQPHGEGAGPLRLLLKAARRVRGGPGKPSA
jgi:hypothetical protein